MSSSSCKKILDILIVQLGNIQTIYLKIDEEEYVTIRYTPRIYDQCKLATHLETITSGRGYEAVFLYNESGKIDWWNCETVHLSDIQLATLLLGGLD